MGKYTFLILKKKTQKRFFFGRGGGGWWRGRRNRNYSRIQLPSTNTKRFLPKVVVQNYTTHKNLTAKKKRKETCTSHNQLLPCVVVAFPIPYCPTITVNLQYIPSNVMINYYINNNYKNPCPLILKYSIQEEEIY